MSFHVFSEQLLNSNVTFILLKFSPSTIADSKQSHLYTLTSSIILQFSKTYCNATLNLQF